MVNDLVTLNEVKSMLRYDGALDDARLSLLIGAASNSILRYLKTEGNEYRETTDGNITPGLVPDDIKIATVMLVGMMDRNPDGNDDKVFNPNEMPAPVQSILHSLREPTIA